MNDESQRNSALLLALGGLKPSDIALALNVDESKVIAWIKPNRRRGSDEQDETA